MIDQPEGPWEKFVRQQEHLYCAACNAGNGQCEGCRRAAEDAERQQEEWNRYMDQRDREPAYPDEREPVHPLDPEPDPRDREPLPPPKPDYPMDRKHDFPIAPKPHYPLYRRGPETEIPELYRRDTQDDVRCVGSRGGRRSI